MRAGPGVLPLASLAIAALAAAGLAQTDPGRALLDRAGVAAPVEPYTELAFANPAALPPPVRNGRISVAFTIRNAEVDERLYAWEVTTRVQPEPDRRLANGTLALGVGQTRQVRKSIPVECDGRRQRVAITLGPRQTIGFWLRCGEPR
jgi:hypothetical protein